MSRVLHLPISLQVGLVADQGYGNVLAGDPLVLGDGLQIVSCRVETRLARDAVDDDEAVGPLQVAVRVAALLKATAMM